jgi:hypothetical protein
MNGLWSLRVRVHDAKLTELAELLDLNVKMPGFEWDKVMCKGSRSLVLWESPDLAS